MLNFMIDSEENSDSKLSQHPAFLTIPICQIGNHGRLILHL